MKQGNGTASASDAGDNPVNPILRTLIVVSVSTMITFGNVLNVRILRMTKQIPTISRMCLLNLSCSDLIVGVVACAPCVYPAATGRWPFGVIWCQTAGIIHGMSVTVSIWSLALVSVDRYVAVVYPLRYYVYVTEQRCGRVLATMWLVAFITYAAPLPFYRFVYYEYSVSEVMCGLHWADPWFCIVTGLFVPVLSGGVLAFTAGGIRRAVAALSKVGVAPGNSTEAAPALAAKGGTSVVRPGNSEVSHSIAAQCDSNRKQTTVDDTRGCTPCLEKDKRLQTHTMPQQVTLAENQRINSETNVVDPVVEINTILGRLHQNLQIIANVIHQSRDMPGEAGQSNTGMDKDQMDETTASMSVHVNENRNVANSSNTVDVVPETTTHTDDAESKAMSMAKRRQQTTLAASGNPSQEGVNMARKELKMMRLLVVTVLAFFISWGPYVFVNVLLIAILDYHQVSPVVRFASTWLGNSNSFINIIIYSCVYSTFRKNAAIVVRATFFCHRPCHVQSATNDSVTL
ncbi:hypothetical protein LSAT2_003994 [Lamellibrachia satsuma]|nr:hypothetical protein LSAT2_003994 [Lamellibrachia satsuma]